MLLLTKAQREKMLANGAAAMAARLTDGKTADCWPVVKLFVPWGAGTWLLTELESEDGEDIAFGLCDLGQGFPELGYVSLSELASVRGPAGLTIERDRYFRASKPLSQYAAEAREAGRVAA